jgi:hypothetical protein
VDYLLPEAASRLDALRAEVLGHLAAAPDSLLVVEEYDKVDCGARGLWRQLLQNPERGNITSNRWAPGLASCCNRLQVSFEHVLCQNFQDGNLLVS